MTDPPTNQASRRRLLRFSLRTLLLGILVLSGGWRPIIQRQLRPVQSLHRDLQRWGGYFLDRVVAVNLWCSSGKSGQAMRC